MSARKVESMIKTDPILDELHKAQVAGWGCAWALVGVAAGLIGAAVFWTVPLLSEIEELKAINAELRENHLETIEELDHADRMEKKLDGLVRQALMQEAMIRRLLKILDSTATDAEIRLETNPSAAYRGDLITDPDGFVLIVGPEDLP